MPLDLDAPILPGIGAAGVRLLDDLDSALAGLTPDDRTNLPHGRTTARIGPVTLGAIDGVVTGIHLGPGYRGLVADAIGIGSTLAEVASALGPLDTREGHVLSVPQVPGWWILAVDPPPDADPSPDFISHHPRATIRLIEVSFPEYGWWTS